MRYSHATCYIAGPLTGQQHPLLMMAGGVGIEGALGDVWLLDVDKWQWSEVSVPERESICIAKEDISFITMMPCEIQHFEDSLHVFTTVYSGRGAHVVWFKIGDCGSPIYCNV